MKSHPSAKQQVVALLRNVARQIQAMDEATLNRVLEGGFRIDADLPSKPKPIKKQSACSAEQISELKAALSKIDSHEEARRAIGNSFGSRAQLVSFARALDIPAPKNATSAELKERLVEATVGFRVRSAAIRGKPMHLRTGPGGSHGCSPLHRLEMQGRAQRLRRKKTLKSP